VKAAGIGADPASEGYADLFMVEGMFCAACAASLEHRLSRLVGVVGASVDLAAGAALVRWGVGARDTAAVEQAIRTLGYRARRPGAASSSGARDPGRDLQLRLVLALFFGMWTMLPSIGLYLDAAPDTRTALGLAWAAGLASLPVVLFCGTPFYRMALATLRAGAPGVDALVSIGALGALVLSCVSLARGEADVYFEVPVALITLQLLARVVELGVLRSGRDAVARVLDLNPPRVVRRTAAGRLEEIALQAVRAGDELLAESGDTLSADGVVVAPGTAEDHPARVDRHRYSGESAPVRLRDGDTVFAGDVVVDGPLRLQVTAPAGKRRVDELERKVRTLLMDKPAWQRAIDRIARHFLVLAALAAAAAAGIATLHGLTPLEAGTHALAVFVIACPCALSLAAPLTGLAAAQRLARARIALRDLRVVTGAASVDTVFLDKTGTLTEGRPRVCALYPLGATGEEELLREAARAEAFSRHPFARAIVDAARRRGLVADPELESESDGARRTVVAAGVCLTIGASTLRVGSAAWLAGMDLSLPALPESSSSRVWVARDQSLLGAIDLEDPLRVGAREALDVLRSAGLRLVVLSGDEEGPVASVCERLGIEGRAHCSPEDKVAHVQAARAQGSVTAFVGDGLNDGPAIAAADVGIAVDSALNAARTASAVTLLDGGVERLPELLNLLRRADRVLRANIGGALVYNLVAIPAAMAGWVHPAIAAVAMAASSLTIVLNASRLGLAPDPTAMRAMRPTRSARYRERPVY